MERHGRKHGCQRRSWPLRHGADDGHWNGGVMVSCGTEVVQTDRQVSRSLSGKCFEHEESDLGVDSCPDG